jgi:hypothetical protein
MEAIDKIKLFTLSQSIFERELDKVERKYSLDLKRYKEEVTDDVYYPQFDHLLRVEAHSMGKHYELFYCLEKSIRKLVEDTLEATNGKQWWEKCIPETIKNNVEVNIRREIDSGITIRSEKEIDYTTFGELGEIVKNNWSDFDAIFSSQKTFNKIMTSLNNLRGPIAHCCALAEDEIVRLQLALKDWFRLME